MLHTFVLFLQWLISAVSFLKNIVLILYNSFCYIFTLTLYHLLLSDAAKENILELHSFKRNVTSVSSYFSLSACKFWHFSAEESTLILNVKLQSKDIFHCAVKQLHDFRRRDKTTTTTMITSNYQSKQLYRVEQKSKPILFTLGVNNSNCYENGGTLISSQTTVWHWSICIRS